MATDTGFGKVRKFEDFLVTAIADLPEIDTLAVTDTGVTEIIAGSEDGWIGLGVHTTDDDDRAAISFGSLQWHAGNTDLKMEERCYLSNITDNKFFVGFSDSIASADETIFSATLDVVTIDTVSDAIGFVFDNDATTIAFWCCAGKTDAVTLGQILSTKYNPVINTVFTLGVWLSADRKTARFSINGEEVYRISSSSTLIAAVDLVPIVQNLEQGTANILAVDYLFGDKPRGTGS